MKKRVNFSEKSFKVIAVITAITVLAVSVSTVSLTAFAKSQRLVPIYSVERDDNKISISFDCAWGVDYTDVILDECDKAGVKVTFFAVEFWVEKYPDYAKKIVQKGHDLGTHSKTHSYMSKLSINEIREELISSSKSIEEITGQKVTLFRPPYGDYDNDLMAEATNQGLYTIQWDVDSLDWKNLSAKEISFRVINKVKSGSIILCHNNGLHTAESLPIIFEFLKNKGYEFVPISELIYKEDYTVDATGRQRRNKET